MHVYIYLHSQLKWFSQVFRSNTDSQYLLCTCYAVATLPRASHGLSHVIFTKTRSGKYSNSSYFTSEETEGE